MRGRRPLAAETLALQGSRRAPTAVAGPELAHAEVEAPEFVVEAHSAQWWWRRLVEYGQGGVFRSSDEVLLWQLATALERIGLMEARLNASGPVVKTELGKTVLSPWYRALKSERAVVLSMLDRSGLTPSARRTILGAVAPAPKRDAEEPVQVFQIGRGA